MPHPFFTIGHSNRSFGELVDLLRAADVDLVADVRTIPRSRSNPQFNADSLSKELEANRIGYVHLPALGGLRGRSRDLPTSTNAFWENLALGEGQSRINALPYQVRAGASGLAVSAAPVVTNATSA